MGSRILSVSRLMPAFYFTTDHFCWVDFITLKFLGCLLPFPFSCFPFCLHPSCFGFPQGPLLGCLFHVMSSFCNYLQFSKSDQNTHASISQVCISSWDFPWNFSCIFPITPVTAFMYGTKGKSQPVCSKLNLFPFLLYETFASSVYIPYLGYWDHHIPSRNLENSPKFLSACVINKQTLSILLNKCLSQEIPSLHSACHW